MNKYLSKKEFNALKYQALILKGCMLTNKISSKKSIKENKEILYQYFSTHLEQFFSLFSLRAFNTTKAMLKDNTICFDDSMTHDEDYDDLLDLGIINSQGRIAIKYKALFKKSLKLYEDPSQIAMYQTFFKGLLDLYGLINIKDIYSMFKVCVKDKIKYSQFRHILKVDTRLALHSARDNFGNIIRVETVPFYQSHGHIQTETIGDLPYKIFPLKTILNFADTFDVNGSFPFKNTELELFLFFKHLSCVSELTMDDEVLSELDLSPENLTKILEYDRYYPKWTYKGHNLPEFEQYYYQDRFDAKKDMDPIC